MTSTKRADLIEEIVRELRSKREVLERLLIGPGQLIIHVNPGARDDRIRLEAQVKVWEF